MSWEVMVIVYLMMGLGFSWMSDKGHRALYSSPLPWPSWAAGIIGWPIIFIAGWRK